MRGSCCPQAEHVAASCLCSGPGRGVSSAAAGRRWRCLEASPTPLDGPETSSAEGQGTSTSGGTMAEPRTIAEPWQNHGGNIVEPWQNHGGTMAEPWRNLSEPWRNQAESWRNHGGTMAEPWRNHARSMTRPAEPRSETWFCADQATISWARDAQKCART